jgi:leucyl aminopeptidase
MEFNIKSGSPKSTVACVIVGVYESRKLTFAADLLDRISNGFISDVIVAATWKASWAAR